MILKSKEDASINFVSLQPDGGYFEARYVRRSPEYIVVYLSSQSGCRQGCRMCHLTATKQTSTKNATPEEFAQQASTVLDWYWENDPVPAKSVNFDFMARGDFFASTEAICNSQRVFTLLDREAFARGLVSRFLISTIMPHSIRHLNLAQVLRPIQPEIYYSIYSVDPIFRKKWLPNAMDPQVALNKLATYQHQSRKIVKLHWAFIEGENDTEESVREICRAVKGVNLRADINIVRYNPFSDKLGAEPPKATIDHLAEVIRTLLPAARVDIVPKVGTDVKAACGMFVTGGAPSLFGS